MTDPTPAREPVTLDEQIEAVSDEMEQWAGICAHTRSPDCSLAPDFADRKLAALSAAVATLQQHTRAMAVVEAVRAVLRYRDPSVVDDQRVLRGALAAFDTAEPSEKP